MSRREGAQSIFQMCRQQGQQKEDINVARPETVHKPPFPKKWNVKIQLKRIYLKFTTVFLRVAQVFTVVAPWAICNLSK